MKRIAFTTFLLVLMVAVPTFANELLSNGGFETGSLPPWAAGRDFCFGTCIPWQVTNSTSHSGTFSATVTGNLELRQDFTPTAGSSISSVTFWTIAGFSGGAIDFFYTDGSDEEFTYTASNTSWTFVDASADVDTSKVLSGFSIWGGSPGGVYFYDDLSIVSGASTPEPGTFALLGSAILGMAGVVRRKLIP